MAAQKIGATGILKGEGVPYNWANRTLFHPDSLVNRSSLVQDLAEFSVILPKQQPYLSLSEAIDIIVEIAKKNNLNSKSSTWNLSNKRILTDQIKSAWLQWKFGSFNTEMPLSRIQFAELFNAVINPFELKQIDHNGTIKPTY
jgi:hypothetical protein